MFGNKKTPKVLVVEDNEINHPLYRDAFTAAGFEICICQNAEDDFVAEVLEVAPDIISMDLMLGSEIRQISRDGFDALELLKGDSRTSSIPVFVCTNFLSEEKVTRAAALGAVDFINLAGVGIPRLPEIFLLYLKKPKDYRPIHPAFNKS